MNLFVAAFIGSPSMNLLEGRFLDLDGKWFLEVGSQCLAVNDELVSARPGLRAYLDRPVVVGIRPEDMEDAALVDTPREQILVADAELVEAMGSDIVMHFSVDAAQVLTEDTRELARDIGAEEAERLEASAQRRRTEMVARLVREGRRGRGRGRHRAASRLRHRHRPFHLG